MPQVDASEIIAPTTGQITDPDEVAHLNATHAAAGPSGGDVVTQALKNVLGPIGEVVAKSAASWGVGATDLVQSLMGLPMDARNAVRGAFYRAAGMEPPPDEPGGASDIHASTSELVRQGFLPKTYTPEGGYKYVRSASQFANSMLIPPGEVSGGTVAAGALAGGAGELAANLMPESGAARPLAEMASLIPAAVIAHQVPRSALALRSAMTEAAPQLARMSAEKLANDQALGMNTSLANTMDPASELAAVVGRISASGGAGADLRRFKALEAAEMERQKAQRIAEVSPGVVPGAQTDANEILQAGDAAIKAPQEQVGAITKPPYDQAMATTLPNQTVSDLAQSLLGSVYSKGALGTGGPAEGVLNLVNQLPGNYPGGVGTFQALDNLAKKAQSEAGFSPGMSGREKANALDQGTIAGGIKDPLKEISPAYTIANLLHSSGQDLLVNPVNRGPLTTLFTDEARTAGKGNMPQMVSAIHGMAAPDIVDVATRMNAVDPTAFPRLVANDFVKTGTGASPAKFVEDIAGANSVDPGAVGQRAAFKAKIEQTALAHGMSPAAAADAAKGADNWATAVLNVAGGHANIEAATAEEFAKQGGTSTVSKALRLVNPLHPDFLRTWSFANLLDKATLARTQKQISEALTSPDGIQRLQSIANYNPYTQSAKVLTQGGFGVAANTGAGQ